MRIKTNHFHLAFSILIQMAAHLVDRLAMLTDVHRFPGMDAADSHSSLMTTYMCMTDFIRRYSYVPLRHFWGDVLREFMQRLSVVIDGTLGAHLRDALREGSVDIVACLPAPRD
jgi:hypothetical protein